MPTACLVDAAQPGVAPSATPKPAFAPPAVALGVLALLALVGCARDGQDWSAAQDADTREAYDAFLAKHPQSEFALKATERATQLVEERDWAVATQLDTPEAYRKFLDQHADGKWTQEARIRIENFNVMAASAPDFAPSAPTPTPAPEPGAATSGAHRVQLGAFSSMAKAEAEWQRLRARFASLSSLVPRITAVQTATGRLFRLQAGLPDAAAARALCDTLKAGGQACLHVPPK